MTITEITYSCSDQWPEGMYGPFDNDDLARAFLKARMDEWCSGCLHEVMNPKDRE